MYIDIPNWKNAADEWLNRDIFSLLNSCDSEAYDNAEYEEVYLICHRIRNVIGQADRLRRDGKDGACRCLERILKKTEIACKLGRQLVIAGSKLKSEYDQKYAQNIAAQVERCHEIVCEFMYGEEAK